MSFALSALSTCRRIEAKLRNLSKGFQSFCLKAICSFSPTL